MEGGIEDSILSSKMDMMKTCSKCGETKPVVEFSRNRREKDGLQSWCKGCNRKYREANKQKIREDNREYRSAHRKELVKYGAEWREIHRDEIMEYGRKYREANRQSARECSHKWREDNPEYAKEYRAANREKIRESSRKYNREYYSANKERLREYSREHGHEWRRENPEHAREWRAANKEKVREWRVANKERLRQYARQWAKKNPEKCCAIVAKRNALKRKATVGSIEAIQRIYDLAQNGNRVRCYLCGKMIPKGERHVDHIVPLSKGGAHSASNLAVACASCNLKKHAKMPEEVGILI